MSKDIRIPDMPPDPPRVYLATEGQKETEAKSSQKTTLTPYERRVESERDLSNRLKEANAATTKLPIENANFTEQELGMSFADFEGLRVERRLHLANSVLAQRSQR